MTGLGVKAGTFLLGAILSFAGAPTGPGPLAVSSVVSTGHHGAVLAVERDDARGALVTAGSDGTLRVWDTRTHGLLRRIPVTRRTVKHLSLDPAAPLAAVVVTDGARAWELSVWNWRTGARVYALPLAAQPLFTRFSQSGTYLLCGLMSADSLHVYRAGDGSTVPFSAGPLAMVGFAETSRTDRILMTYELSGRIRYWEMASGSVARDVETVRDILDPAISLDRRVLVGRSGSGITGVDTLTGTARFRVDGGDVVAMDVSPSADRVACITRDGGLHVWGIGANAAALSDRVAGTHPGATVVSFQPDGILVGEEDGALQTVTDAGEAAPYAGDETEQVSDIAFADHTLVIGTSRTIGIFPLDGAPGAERRLGAPQVLPNPFASPVVFSPASGDRVLAWPRDAEAGSLAVIDIADRTCRDLGIPFTGPLLGAGSIDGRVYTLARDGEIRVVDEATGALRFSTTRPGATCIAALGPDTLVVGRAPGGDIASSLVQISVGTGETVPLAGPNVYTASIIADPAQGLLCSLGVDERGRSNVVLLRGGGDPIVAGPSAVEIPTAAFALDAAHDLLYADADGDGIAAWENGVMSPLADPDLGAVRIRVDDSVVASVGRDSLVALWDAASRRQLALLATFPDGGWVAVMPDGSFAGSPTGREHVAVLLAPPGK